MGRPDQESRHHTGLDRSHESRHKSGRIVASAQSEIMLPGGVRCQADLIKGPCRSYVLKACRGEPSS